MIIIIGSETATSVETEDSFYFASMAIMGPEEISIVQACERQLQAILDEEEEA